MRKTKLVALLLLTVCTVSLLSGCGKTAPGDGDGTADETTKEENSEHEAITIGDYTELIKLVHEKYPEINVQIEPYKGGNATGYMKK